MDFPLVFKIGAKVCDRVNMILDMNMLNVPYDPGGTCLESGETIHESKLFWQAAMAINNEQIDFPFDPGGFEPETKLEDEFFLRGGV